MSQVMKYQKHVLLTLMCQHCINTGKMVDAKIVMRWCRVSKPTALEILDEYRKSGHIERFSQRWRSNSVKYSYRPLKSIFTQYRRGDFREQYKAWLNGNNSNVKTW